MPTHKKTCCQICPVGTKIGDISPCRRHVADITSQEREGEGRLLRCAPLPILSITPPTHTPHRHAIASAGTDSPGLIRAMQRQGGETCSCRCITRFFPLVFFCCKLVRAGTHDASKKFPFPTPIHRLPLSCPSIPLFPPPHLRTLPPNDLPMKMPWCRGLQGSYSCRSYGLKK